MFDVAKFFAHRYTREARMIKHGPSKVMTVLIIGGGLCLMGVICAYAVMDYDTATNLLDTILRVIHIR